ncbi:ketopantoate reductase family protein [Brachybacterium nesterenkovii]|uniref:ketopantoate reductase family protein n=1 Tax=Brachybacterium nesterenkovii TaxID=47847 RepID=UPI00321BCFBD
MRFTIIGAGTIGLTYGHLLSRMHDVDYVVPDGRRSAYEGSFHLHLHDLRDGTDSVREFTPRLLSDVSASEADAILVMAPGDRLPELLPHPASSAPPHIPLVLMLNRWDLEREARLHLPRSRFHLGFPSQVGGGRQGRHVHATVFRTGTVLETGHAAGRRVMDAIEEAFRAAGLSVARQCRMSDWLRIHCLQQPLTAAPLLDAGGYDELIGDRARARDLVLAFRKGLRTCRAAGSPPGLLWPSPLFRLSAPVVTRLSRACSPMPMCARWSSATARTGAGMDLGLPRHPRLSDGRGLSTPMLDRRARVLDRCARDPGAPAAEGPP